jgi:GLPGLI family protein
LVFKQFYYEIDMRIVVANTSEDLNIPPDSYPLKTKAHMKYYYLLILLGSTFFSSSQSLVVNYSEKRIISKESLEKMPEFAREEATASHSYVLKYKDGVSYYSNSEESTNMDATQIGFQKNETKSDNIVISESSHRFTNRSIEKWFYKDVKNNILLFKMFNNKDINGKDKLISWDWKVTNETKNINGFLCKKAISEYRGYYFVAWFTEDIAINGGPEKFDGLPGLILYVGTPYFEYLATSINTNIDVKTISRPISTMETLTMAELDNYIKAGVSGLKSSTTSNVNGNTTTTTITTIITN